MSIWRSPVFYFGIGLLLVVGLLLVAPFVVDWNSYKSNLEAYGKRLTGREVTIAGDIEVRLFPWPRLTADHVAVANPVGIAGPDLIAAEQLTFSLALGALMNGTLSVESIAIDQPRITLIRTENGAVNWMVKSDEDLRSSPLLSQVRLDHILLWSGTARLEDRLRGLNANLTGLDSEMSAATIEGPWKIKGSAQFINSPLAFSFSSSTYDSAEPFKFVLRVTPSDTILPSFAVDGGWNGTAFDGALRVEPQSGESQKGSVEGGLRPVTLSTALHATAEKLDFTDIRIAPADVKDSGTLIEGKASLELGDVTNAEVMLKAPRINLDTLLGAETLSTWRDGGALALAHSVLKLIPENMSGRFGIDATVLTSAGVSIENVEFLSSLTPDGIHIERALMGLPGRSKALMTDAMILRRDGGAELVGPVAFESQDARAFAMWAFPNHKLRLEQWWKGNRGRLKFSAKSIWSSSQFALTDMDYELDGQPGKTDIKMRLGESAAVDVVLNSPFLDLDSYLARNAASFSKGKAFDALAMVQPLLSGNDVFDAHLKVDAGQVALNGVTAKRVAFDVTSSRSGFEIKALDIGDVGGATLKAEGLMLSRVNGASGEVTARLSAADPTGFLRLIGLATVRAQWQQSLGATDVGFTLRARPDDAGPQLDYTLQGRSGAMTLNFGGSLADLERGADAQISMSGDVRTADASHLLPFFGLSAKQAAVGQGDLKLGFSGSRGLGFASSATLKGFGANISFDGVTKPEMANYGLSGQVNVQAEDVTPFMAVLGIPQKGGANGPLRLAFKLTPDADALNFTDVVGDFGNAPVSGSGSIDRDGLIKADVELGHVDALAVMAMAFSPWDGGTAEVARRFGLAKDLPFWGEIWLRPKTFALPFWGNVSEAAIGVTLGETREFKVLAPTSTNLGFSVSVMPAPEGFQVVAKGKVPVDAAKVFRLSDGAELTRGQLMFDGEVSGKGRSPGAVLAAASGGGKTNFTNFAFLRFAPEVFAQRLEGVKSATELASAFGVLEQSEGVVIVGATSEFDVKDGVLTVAPINVSAANTETQVALGGDAVGRTISLSGTVQIPARSELPRVGVVYSGDAGSVTKRTNTAQLAAVLGHDLLARDLEALEKLQQQQQALVKQEEEQRLDDVAKFEAYQAQRSELRQRQRELKVYAVLRQRREKATSEFLANFVEEGDAINKIELVRYGLARSLKGRLETWSKENSNPELRAKREEEQRKRIEAAALKKAVEEAKKLEAKRRADAKKKKPVAVEKPDVEVVPEVPVDIQPSPEPSPAPAPAPAIIEDGSLY